MKKLVLSLAMLTTAVTPAAFADSTYLLRYQQDNRWVAVEDGVGLRSLLRDAKKQDHTIFSVVLPKESRALSVERLIVLRDILEKSLKKGIILEEKRGETESNSILVEFSN